MCPNLVAMRVTDRFFLAQGCQAGEGMLMAMIVMIVIMTVVIMVLMMKMVRMVVVIMALLKVLRVRRNEATSCELSLCPRWVCIPEATFKEVPVDRLDRA